MTTQAKRLTPEELLQPRYEVIADWPNNTIEIGDVCTIENEYGQFRFGQPIHQRMMEAHPHLFKKLCWWEERKEEDMPEYLKVTVDHMEHYGTKKGDIIKVIWCYGVDKNWVPFWSEKNKIFWGNYSVPATLQDYTQYITNLNANK